MRRSGGGAAAVPPPAQRSSISVTPANASAARFGSIALVDGRARREVLHGEPGRVEDGDLGLGASGRPRAPLRTRPSSGTSSRPMRPASTARAMSPLWLACSHSSQTILARRSSSGSISDLPGPSAPMRLTCWPGRSVPGPTTCSRPGVTVASTSQANASARSAVDDAAGPSSAATQLGLPGSCVEEQNLAAAVEEGSCHGRTVDAAADDRGPAGLRAGERLGGQHGGGSGPERCHRSGVEQRQELAVAGIGEQHDARHRRKAAGRIPGE